MVELTITHADGSTETIPETVGRTRTRELGHMRRVTIDVERSLANAVTLEPKQDKIDLGSIDTLRLVDVETGGPTWTLVCYSFEWDANREEFTPGGDLREGDDQTLITNLVGEVDSWTAGTVENHTGPLSFVLNHAHRHEALRRIERNVPGEIQFRDEGTVDYVENLGSDKTGSVTLSAANGNIENEIQITNRGRELDGTHIRVLGAHEGEAQIFANLVPSDDPATYENRVDYETDRWSDGDARDWDRWENKDVADQDTIEEEAATLGEEITESLVEAEATVAGEDLSVGDWVHVEKSDADLNRDMRVHRIMTVTEGAKQVDDLLLSTRTTVRKGDAQDLEDIQRFNTGWQGASVAMNIGPHEDSVDGSNPTSFGFRYPGLEYENRAEIQVRGEEYRIDSQGAAGGGDHFHEVDVGATTDDNTDYGAVSDFSDSVNGVTVGSSYTELSSWFISDTCSEVQVLSRIIGSNTTDSTHLAVRVRDGVSGETVPVSGGHFLPFGGDAASISLPVPGDRSGSTMYLEARTVGDSDMDVSADTRWYSYETHQHDFETTETSDASGDHVHPPQPGIYGTNDTPSNVDVLINGDVVATDIGSGTFQTEIDVGGEFDVDAWNEVEIQSDSLGDIQATAYLEGYDQIGTR